MSNLNSPLDTVQTASPCPADWDKMSGDEQRRFCGECGLHVYNISAMTRPEAEALIIGSTGRLCIGIYRRADGTIITRDCPVGMRAVRQRVWRTVRKTVATGVTVAAGFFGLSSIQTSKAMESDGGGKPAGDTTEVADSTEVKGPYIMGSYSFRDSRLPRRPAHDLDEPPAIDTARTPKSHID